MSAVVQRFSAAKWWRRGEKSEPRVSPFALSLSFGIQLPIGGSVLHLFSSRRVLSTSGENGSLMLNSLRTSSGVLSAWLCVCVPKAERQNGGAKGAASVNATDSGLPETKKNTRQYLFVEQRSRPQAAEANHAAS